MNVFPAATTTTRSTTTTTTAPPATTTTTAAPTTTTTAAPTVLGEVLVAPAPELPRTGSDGPRRLGVAGFVMAALGVLLVSLMALVRRRRTMSADRH